MTEHLEQLAGQTSENFHSDIDWWPGRMLFVLRDLMGYSQLHIAKELGISRGRIASYETCKTRMPSEVISKAAEFFGVLPSAFFKKVDLKGDVDEVLDRIAFDFEFEQMLNKLTDSQRRRLLQAAHVLF